MPVLESLFDPFAPPDPQARRSEAPKEPEKPAEKKPEAAEPAAAPAEPKAAEATA